MKEELIKKVSTATADHYTWGDNCDGWHFLKSNGLSIIKEKMPPGTSEKLHYHEKAEQFFYIVSGSATFEIDNQCIHVSTNEAIIIKPGLKHYVKNETPDEIEFIVVSRPPSHGDRINVE